MGQSLCFCFIQVFVWIIWLVDGMNLARHHKFPSWGQKYLETYGTFPNSFHLKVKQLVQRIERIKDRIGRQELSVLFNQTYIYQVEAS